MKYFHTLKWSLFPVADYPVGWVGWSLQERAFKLEVCDFQIMFFLLELLFFLSLIKKWDIDTAR
jgi:hypothetical protein